MSEPKDSDAQNLDLSALDDALGGGGKKGAVEADKSQGAYSIGDEQQQSGGKEAATTTTSTKATDSPKTLSPSSPRSISPNLVAATNTATPTPAVDAETQGKIKAIRGMFPSLDEDTVGAVLAAEGGDEESAINVLLSMSDPDSAPPPAPKPRTATNTGAMTDEELARALALEEDEAFARASARQEQQRYAARQQSQPGGRGGGNSGAGGMFQDFFGGGGGSTGTRGGGGAASFFNDLKQRAQPLFDGKGPLAKGSQNAESINTWGDARGSSSSGPAIASGPTAGNYDPSQLTYQPRVRKGVQGQAGQTPAQWAPPQQQQQWGAQQPQQQQWGAQQQQRAPPTVPPKQQPQPTSAWSQGGRYAKPTQWGGGGSSSEPTQSSRSLGKTAVIGGAGAGVGAATAAVASSSTPSVASVLQEGGHKGEDVGPGQQSVTLQHNDEEDDDDDDNSDDDDDLEFQKSPFDDED